MTFKIHRVSLGTGDISGGIQEKKCLLWTSVNYLLIYVLLCPYI